jgi:peptide deformylase
MAKDRTLPTFQRPPRVLKIAKMGHPVLRAQAMPVQDPRDPEIALIVEDMKHTIYESISSTGLAAPQVHIPLRIILIMVHQECGTEVPLTTMINPTWEPLSQEKITDWEGCMSLPDLFGEVSRYSKIRYTYQTLEGETISGTAEGFHARVIQHECDHLEGKLYVDQMENLLHMGYREELHKAMERAHAQHKAKEKSSKPNESKKT